MMLTSDSEIIKEQVFCVKTLNEFLERLQQHEISTASKFILAKSCKRFSQEKAVLSNKLKLHWQDEFPYFHFGARLYLCHQGKDNNKYQKKKYASNRDKKADHSLVKRYNLTKVSKKLDCPAFVKVTRIVKILEHRVTEPITHHRKGIISHLIKKKISESKLIGEECYIFNLPAAEEHKFHELGAEAAAIEPVDHRVKEHLLELVHNGEKDLKTISKKLIFFVENELGEHDRTRRRFYPDRKTLRKFAARARSNMDKNIVLQMTRIDHENDSSSETPHTESSDSFKVQNSLKNSLINECNLTIQSIISSFESLDEASLQSLSRTLKDIHNEISCGIKPEVRELNSAIKTETVIGFVIKGPELVKPEGYAEIEKPVGCDGVNKECEEQPSKRARTYEKKKKEKGQNKNRGPTYRQNRESLLCPQIFEGNECPLEKCIYVHDIKKFLEDKPPDIDSVCPVFSVRGLCPRGVTCRYGSQHIDKEGNSIVDQSLLDEWEANKQAQTINSLSKSVQVDLRKRKYDFARSEEALLRLDKRKPKTKPESEKEANASENGSELSQTKDVAENCIGPADTEFPRSVREKKRSIDWKDKLYLSPLTTVGNLPFRRICKEFGVDITCGEMAMASNILQGANQEWALIKRHGTEDIFGVQVCGNNPYVLTRCAQVLQEQADIDFVDINMGCPIDLVYQQGGGCGLMRREKVLYSVVECMNDVLDIPLTIKMRTGIYSDKSTAHKLISGLCARGVSLITVHGRSREQRYTRSADWSYIETCAKLAGETPLFGNGDILSYEDYVEARKNCPSISGVMIGRGALIKPWIFTEIKEQRMWDISSNERFEIIKKYVNYGLHHWGSDTKGVENTRRFLLEWLSFLYRYIPVGLLETPPQKVNQRPPFYRGRNDLETLMASPNCDDWVKISEMLLGPVPDGFTFLPKHKANSWK